jgi:hypothetical protein
MAKFLYVEDDDGVRRAIISEFAVFFPLDQLVPLVSYQEAVTTIAEVGTFDGIVSDYQYSGVQNDGRPNKSGRGGLDLYQFLVKSGINTPVVYLSGTDPDVIIRAFKSSGINLSKDHLFDKITQGIVEAVNFLKAKYCNEARPHDGQTNNFIDDAVTP